MLRNVLTSAGSVGKKEVKFFGKLTGGGTIDARDSTRREKYTVIVACQIS